jgi:hypothetical protein
MRTIAVFIAREKTPIFCRINESLTVENFIAEILKEKNVLLINLTLNPEYGSLPPVTGNFTKSLEVFDFLQKDYPEMKFPTFTLKYDEVPIITQNSSFQLFLRKLDGKIMPLEVSGDMTISNFKGLVHKKLGIPSYEQRIFHGGNELPNNKTLADLGIGPIFTLNLVMLLGRGHCRPSLHDCVDYKEIGKSEHDYLIN